MYLRQQTIYERNLIFRRNHIISEVICWRGSAKTLTRLWNVIVMKIEPIICTQFICAQWRA